jgi:hypothetical protein
MLGTVRTFSLPFNGPFPFGMINLQLTQFYNS